MASAASGSVLRDAHSAIFRELTGVFQFTAKDCARFLETYAPDIYDLYLEFQEDSDTLRFGKDRVTRLDILHREGGNLYATLIADLTKANDLSSDRFDGMIFTHLLPLVFEFERIISELDRILKPGGVLLVAVSNLSRCKTEFGEMWRFSPGGLYCFLAKQFGEEQVTVQADGNSLTAAEEIRGLVAREFTRAERNWSDPYFPVEVCARAIKR